MLDDGIIRPSMSQWNAPLLIVPKKTDASGKQKLRIVVDFRKLNDLTIGDSFQLPNITNILDQLGNAKFFHLGLRVRVLPNSNAGQAQK